MLLALNTIGVLDFSNKGQDIADGREADLRLRRHIAVLPMVLLYALKDCARERRRIVMAGIVDVVYQRRANLTALAVKAVAGGTVVIERLLPGRSAR